MHSYLLSYYVCFYKLQTMKSLFIGYANNQLRGEKLEDCDLVYFPTCQDLY